MSDYHILQQDKEQKTVSVIFHIAIPAAGTNEAGLSWRDAIVRDQGGSGSISSVLTDISPTEDTKLKAGELYEQQETVRFSSKELTPSQKRTEIEAQFTAKSSEIIAEKQVTLQWIGFDANVS